MARTTTPAAARDAALAIVNTLRRAGHVAYFAGGCVRDELLGLSPTDYDVATDATPERIKGVFKRTNEVGEAFGVVLVTLTPADGVAEIATVEVATFRSDGPYSDRRRPDSVTFSDPQSDARRRDFTVNALFLDPVDSGKVIDFVGGREDLSKKTIRAVGNPEARLAEDHLRALRAVRLAARLGFTIETATASAIRRHAANLHGVSRERIGEEIRRMLAHPTRAAAMELLEGLGLDAPVLDEPHLTNTGTTLRALKENSGYPTCLAAWACDRGLSLSDRTLLELVTRWRPALSLSNEDRDALVSVIRALRMLEYDWASMSFAGRKRLAGSHPGFAGAFELLEARNPAQFAAVRSEVSRLAATPSGLCPEPLITGDDLIREGLKPGPRFKTLLDALYDAQLEDRVRSSGEALELARKLSV